MDQHLSDSEIERYLDENALASDHDRVHGHMAVCASCADTWREIVVAHDALVSPHQAAAPQHATDDDPVDPDVGLLYRDDTRVRTTIIRAATALVVAMVGIAVGRAMPRATEQLPSGNYVLLLTGSHASQRPAAEAQTIRRAFAHWADSLQRAGRLDTPSQLERTELDAIVADSLSSVDVTVLALGQLDAFFLVRASDDADALAIARSSPHMQHGGAIVVRRRTE